MNNKITKPQVILRTEDKHGVHLIKKWHDNSLTVEGHSIEGAKNHNITVPDYCFPVDIDFVKQEFKNAGKEYIERR